MSVDIANGSAPLVHALHASGRRLAAIIGSSVALLSLFNDTPVWVASFRGAMALGAVLTATSIGSWFIRRTWVAPAQPEGEGGEGDQGESAATESADRNSRAA